MTDNRICKRPAAILLAAGLILGLLVLPCGCRPSPALACPAFENTVVSLAPVTETEEPEDSQPVLLYEQQYLPDDGEPETMPSETNVPEIQEEPVETDESLNISSETIEENTENSEPIQEEPVQEEPVQEAPAEEPEQTEQEEETETVPGAEVTEDTPDEDPAPSPPAAVADGVVRAGDSGVSSHYVQMAADAYQQAPQWVRTLFEDAGWHISLRSGNYFGAAYGYSTSLLGLTVYGEGNIYLSAQEAACNRHIICHELGHFIDCWYGWPSSTAEFAGIYNTEYSAFCSCFGYSNGYPSVNELFAEALYHYWTDPGNLQQAAPGTYAYIQKSTG